MSQCHPMLTNVNFIIIIIIIIIIVSIIDLNNQTGKIGLIFYFALLWLTVKLNIFVIW